MSLSREEMMGFADGKIEGEKVFGGRVFPKTYLPSNTWESSGACTDLVDMVRSERVSLHETLEQHGAILFRGFHVNSAMEFSSVVEAFGWEELPYEGAASRVKRADRVYTANEAPLDVFINFHHEMALIKKFPSKIFFLCLQPSPEGGQTSIVPSHIIVEKMEAEVPEVVAKLSEVGMKIKWQREAKVWHRLLKTEDKFEAEKRAVEKLACNSVKFNSDDTADLFYGPIYPIREFGKKKVWFNTILGYTSNEIDPEYSFGDGCPLPLEAVDAYSKILEENCVNVSWQKGDVLLVDNLSVQHARRPGIPPRAVLVSVCK